MATFFVWSGATGSANGTSFTDAYTDLDTVFTTEAVAGGDVIKIADDHDNTSYAASKSWSFPESSQSTAAHVHLISTNRGSGLPSAGAIEQTGGNFSITILYRINCYGVTFKVGSGGSESTAMVNISNTSTVTYGKGIFANCNFVMNSTSTFSKVNILTATRTNKTVFSGCDFNFAAVGQAIALSGPVVTFRQCTLSGTAPTTLFIFGLSDYGSVDIDSCEFSTPTNLTTAGRVSVINANNSKLPTTLTSSFPTQVAQLTAEYHSCGTTDHNYFFYKYANPGTVEHSVAVYLDGGATTITNDGSSVNYSLKLVGATNSHQCSISQPLYTPWFNIGVYSTGSTTFSIKVGHTEAAVLKDTECWIEVDHMGGAAPVNTPVREREISAPLIGSTVYQDFQAAGSNLTDTAVAWTGITSEKTHTLSKTVTVDEQGYARARIALAVNNITIYVDPEITVT